MKKETVTYSSKRKLKPPKEMAIYLNERKLEPLEYTVKGKTVTLKRKPRKKDVIIFKIEGMI